MENWPIPKPMTIRATVHIDPITERDSSQVLHVPRGSPDSKELAEVGYWPFIYLTDYPLTQDQAIDLAVARVTVSEDKLFLKKLVEMTKDTP